jgi:hypothetical protein
MDEILLDNFAAAVLHLYKNKIIEIHTGQTRTTHVLDQFQHDIPYIIRGKVIDAIGSGIILECPTERGIKKILVNAWSINTITEYDSKSSITDVYWDADRKLHK